MTRFRTEKMDLSHLDDIMEIEGLCYGEHHWSRDSFVCELNNSVSDYNCILDKNNKCVAYMGLWKLFDEAHVTNLAVHKDFQKKGLGHMLIMNALDICYKEKIKYITLEVRVSNFKAIKLYEKFGFKSLGERKKYYQNNNEDALIMWTENIFNDSYKALYNRQKRLVENFQ